MWISYSPYLGRGLRHSSMPLFNIWIGPNERNLINAETYVILIKILRLITSSLFGIYEYKGFSNLTFWQEISFFLFKIKTSYQLFGKCKSFIYFFFRDAVNSSQEWWVNFGIGYSCKILSPETIQLGSPDIRSDAIH